MWAPLKKFNGFSPGFSPKGCHAEVNERVSASGAVLLTKLGIRPFEYKMEVRCVTSHPRDFLPANERFPYGLPQKISPTNWKMIRNFLLKDSPYFSGEMAMYVSFRECILGLFLFV